MSIACRHPLCELIGGACSLAIGLSHGCRTTSTVEAFPPGLVEEVTALLASPLDREVATRVAFLFRREAREGRSLLALAADGELEPEAAARLVALCRRSG